MAAPPRPAPLGAGRGAAPWGRRHEPCGGAAMPTERPLRRGSAFRLCLLSAALFLCLQLGVRRSWCPEEKPQGPAAGLGPPRAPLRGPPQPPGRRRVTYVRSGRRRGTEPGCCPPQPPGGPRRKVGVGRGQPCRDRSRGVALWQLGGLDVRPPPGRGDLVVPSGHHPGRCPLVFLGTNPLFFSLYTFP